MPKTVLDLAPLIGEPDIVKIAMLAEELSRALMVCLSSMTKRCVDEAKQLESLTDEIALDMMPSEDSSCTGKRVSLIQQLHREATKLFDSKLHSEASRSKVRQPHIVKEAQVLARERASALDKAYSLKATTAKAQDLLFRLLKKDAYLLFRM